MEPVSCKLAAVSESAYPDADRGWHDVQPDAVAVIRPDESTDIDGTTPIVEADFHVADGTEALAGDA